MAADTCRCGSNIGYYEGIRSGTCQNKVIAGLGKGEYSKQDWDSARNQEYGAFARREDLFAHMAPASITRGTSLSWNGLTQDV